MAGDVQFDTTDPKKTAMDYAEHARTYDGFLHLLKVGSTWAICTVIALVIVNAGWNVTAALFIFVATIACLLWMVFGVRSDDA
jgi:hypothetical protein